ncbi:hypothetical protein P5673_027390, partial [Acropora cervicornis]
VEPESEMVDEADHGATSLDFNNDVWSSSPTTIDNQVQCSSCERTIKENKELKQEVKVLKFKVTTLSNKMAHNQQQWVKTLQEMQKPSDDTELRPDCEIQKVLTKLSKEKDCEIIGHWRKACVRHFYWAVTSTNESLGKVKLAKFQAFLSHVINQHRDLPNRLFNACAHGDNIKPKVWMLKVNLDLQATDLLHSILVPFISATEAYEKMSTALNKTNLRKAIEKASSVEQTSCLEGYHSVVNQFAPKMLAYSYLGMLSRSILAALHFNYNLQRDAKKNGQGQPRLCVTYPKYKDGEATVREAKIATNYDYVAEINQAMVTTSRQDLKQVANDLK